jgi:hypothetical protein
VDVKDTVNKWCVAEVLKLTDTEVTVHYKGWGAKYDDTITKDSDRLAALGTHTTGKDTGYAQRSQGGVWELGPEELQQMRARLDTALAAPEEEDNQAFFKTVLPDFVAQCLSSTFVVEELLPGDLVNEFLLQLMQAFVEALKCPTPLSAEFVQLGTRLFGADPRCKWFYARYGLEKAASKGGAPTLPPAPFARVPPQLKGRLPDVSRFFVQNVNRFGELGGFDIVLARIERREGEGEEAIPLVELAATLKMLAHGAYCYSKVRVHPLHPPCTPPLPLPLLTPLLLPFTGFPRGLFPQTGGGNLRAHDVADGRGDEERGGGDPASGAAGDGEAAADGARGRQRGRAHAQAQRGVPSGAC